MRFPERFANELELDDDQKADFKIKAKQFVKIYAQLACIMPFDNLAWETLHWLLKFLIPELTIKEQDKEALDDLLESIDLSTYSLARTKLSTYSFWLAKGAPTGDGTMPGRGYPRLTETDQGFDPDRGAAVYAAK